MHHDTQGWSRLGHCRPEHVPGLGYAWLAHCAWGCV